MSERERLLGKARSQRAKGRGQKVRQWGWPWREGEGRLPRECWGGGDTWGGTSGAEDEKPSGYNESPRDKGL